MNESTCTQIYHCSTSHKEYSKGIVPWNRGRSTRWPSKDTKPQLWWMDDEGSLMGISSRKRRRSWIRYLLGHRLIIAIIGDSRLWLYIAPERGWLQRVQWLSLSWPPQSIYGIQGKRRITHSLDITSTPSISTIARLRPMSHSNTIALRTSMEGWTGKNVLDLTHDRITWATKSTNLTLV
jgi:hypothetical protein